MADFVLSSLRGGVNNTDPPLSLPDDQCTVATNVEWVTSMLGERRRGCDAVDVSGSSALAACDRIVWAHRHLPTSDEADAQLWVMGIDGSTAVLAYKDSSWHDVTMSDAPTVDGVSEYQIQGLTLHGKLFIAYNSAVDRLHVWDGTSLRRTGMAAPAAAPTAADDGGAGTFSGDRYYRVRFTQMSGSTVLRRSEPSAVRTFSPNGNDTGAVVTKPATVSEGETHWELEASLDNSNFYRLATTAVGTASVTDTTAFSDGYASFTLSETSGDYTNITSVKHLLADEDRLLPIGSFESDEFAARVSWTPVYKATGVGNDERIPIATVSFRDLDTFEGGPITGGVGPVEGELWMFKRSHTYKMVRTGVRGANAYDVLAISKKRGAIPGSMVEAVDQAGTPAVYAIDQKMGPYRIGANGIRGCGRDIRTTWKTINRNATKVQSLVEFFEDPAQVHWWVPTGSSNSPDTRLVLHVEETEDTARGVRKGWAIWTGPSAEALTVCQFSDNIDDDTDRNLDLVPFIGIEGGGLLLRTDTDDDDNGTAYASSLRAKPSAPANVINQFGVNSGALVAKAVDGAVIDITLIPNFGVDSTAQKEVAGVTMDQSASESQTVKLLDNLGISEARTLEVLFEDPATPGERWELNRLVLSGTPGQGG